MVFDCIDSWSLLSFLLLSLHKGHNVVGDGGETLYPRVKCSYKVFLLRYLCNRLCFLSFTLYTNRILSNLKHINK